MVTQQFSFPPRLKLGKSDDYKKVFAKPVKSSDKFFTLLAINNTCNHPRLGLAIAKKNIKKAVTRNVIKRAIRENFRLKQQQRSNIDVVVLANKAAANATPDLLQQSLDKHWLKLANKCNSCC